MTGDQESLSPDTRAARFQERFKRNLNALSKACPRLEKFLASSRLKGSYDFFETRDGAFNVYSGRPENRLYPRDNPKEQSASLVSAFLAKLNVTPPLYKTSPDPFGMIHARYINGAIGLLEKAPREKLTAAQIHLIPNLIILGTGLGYHIEELVKQTDILCLIIIEPNPDFFFLSLYACDWEGILNRVAERGRQIDFCIGSGPKQLGAELESIYAKNGRFLAQTLNVFKFSPSPESNEIGAYLKTHFFKFSSALGFFDDNLFGLAHALDAVRAETPFMFGVKELSDAAKNTPVFIIGSGPSLDADIPFLRKNQDKALIVACGSALETLYQAGIQPDIYCAAERAPQIAGTIEMIPDKDFLNRITLLTADIIHPKVRALFAKVILLPKADELFFWLAISELKERRELKYLVSCSPLVGNMGLAAILQSGFLRPYLFGLDCGRKPGAADMHSKYSALYQNLRINEKDGNYAAVCDYPGNFGGSCRTGPVFLLSIRALEELLALYKDKVSCVNCSDGCLIQGAKTLRSGELDKSFENLPLIDKTGITAFMLREMAKPLPLEKKSVTEFMDPAGFDRITERLDEIFAGPFERREDLFDSLTAASRFLSEGGNDPQKIFLRKILQGSCQSFFILISYALLSRESESAGLEEALKVIGLFRHFLTDGRQTYRLLPDYAIGPHQMRLKGRIGTDYPESKAPPLPEIRELFDKDKLKALPRIFIKRYQGD